MNNAVLQFVVFLLLLLVLSKPLGEYIGRVLEREDTFMDPVLRPLERGIYRLAGIEADDRMNWKTYAWAVLLFSLAGLLFLVFLQRVQDRLPLNPQHLGPVPWAIALNTAVSFVTNTNWQSYSGETTMSYLTQMLGLTVQNFLSAAKGIAIVATLARGIRRRKAENLGSFWVDLTRITLYILLPLSVVFALFLVSQGVVQTLGPSILARGGQLIALGPVASQEAIKMLGTNGGGFFNANSAHPFENPTALSNYLQILSILLIPAALCHAFGRMVRDRRQGWAILAAMTVIFVVALGVIHGSEQKGNPAFRSLPVAQSVSAVPGQEQAGGNMEGKEVRFGIADSALFATATTATSCGAVNGMHDS